MESNNEICQSAFLTVSVENEKCIFFNNGINGGCYRFDSENQLRIDIQNKIDVNVKVNIKLTSGKDYKQKDVMLYIIY